MGCSQDPLKAHTQGCTLSVWGAGRDMSGMGAPQASLLYQRCLGELSEDSIITSLMTNIPPKHKLKIVFH